ncbi:hypothetical protein GWA97_09610 [Flavobacterium sp. LaA7.5]|nr:hypothetical protein [Flavobacterium salilacus subsp. altitudinum]
MSLGLTPEFILNTTLKVGVIYKFNASDIINTSVPHHFIVIAIENENNYLAVCTTQLDAKIEYFKKRGLDLNTLAYITPNSSNGLDKDTYVNCNDYHIITREKLIEKITTREFQSTGDLSSEEYDKIVAAIRLSHTNDIPRFLLKYRTN